MSFQTSAFQQDIFQEQLVTPAGTIPVPNFVGLGWLHASHVIIDSGFQQTSQPVHQPSRAFPPYTVIGQEPPAGTYVAPKTNIQLTVAQKAALLGATFDTIPWWYWDQK